MNERAIVIAVAYSIVVVLGSLLAFLLYRSTRVRRPIDPEKLADRERNWFVAVAVILVALLFATIFFTPYWRSGGKGKQVVRVTARQFAWSIVPSTVRLGVPVEFRTRAIDVTHGFGVYTAKNKFLFQVQVIPDRDQSVVWTFHKPGTYKVVCMEFCGLNHHGMNAQFEVAP